MLRNGKYSIILVWYNTLGGVEAFNFTAQKSYGYNISNVEISERDVFEDWDNTFTGDMDHDLLNVDAYEEITVRTQRLTEQQARAIGEIKLSPLVKDLERNVQVRINRGSWRVWTDNDKRTELSFTIRYPKLLVAYGMRLKVNDIVLDQFRNTIIAQTYETTNFGDISTRRGGFSNDFTLPLTSKNEEALGYPSDLNIDNRNPYQKVDAQLIDDGAVISIGYLRYKIVSDNTIQCSFFSDNTEWFNLIKDKNLIDLDLSSLDHTWDYTNIETAINAEGSLGYTYPIIDYGEFLSHDTNEVDDTSLFPAIYFSTVLSQIYSDIGWSVTGELLTDERFIRQVVPFCKKSFSHTEQWVNDRYQDISILISAPAPPPITLSPTINITDDGSYRLNVNLNIVMIGIVSSFLTIQYKKNGVIYDTYDTNIDQNTPTRYNNTSSIEVFNNGDVASISILTDAGSQVNIASDSFAYLLPEREIVNSGDTIEMSNILPDISQSDFLKYVFFSYGVIPQSDSYSKTVRLDFLIVLKITCLTL